MQIWILNPYDDVPAEGKPQRFWTLAAELSAQGHEVVWWSSDWSHRRKARRQAPSASVPFQLRLVPTPPYRKNLSLARIWNHRKFGQNLYREACEAVHSGALAKPDVILASMPPMEGPMAALRLRKRYGCRVVTDIMDAWPETWLQVVKGSPPSSPRQRSTGRPLSPPPQSGGELPRIGNTGRWVGAKLALARLLLSPYYRMLRRACQESDAVSAQSVTFAAFAKQYGARAEVHVCYLGADAIVNEASCGGSLPGASGEEATKSAKAGKLAADQATTSNQRPGKLRLLYLGAMERSYDLETLVAACRHLLEAGRSLELHFAGEGAKLAQLQAMTADWAEGTVRFHGFLQKASLLELLQSSDLGVVPMFPQSGVAVPYKVGDYLSAGLPVVNSLPGELEDLLAAHDCGQMYAAGSVDSMVRALTHYFELSTEGWSGAQAGAHALFASHFDRAQSYPRFAEWLVEPLCGE
jgi:glycosyltransferase involved in cell wall biosynthesis